jgi:uncharacterized protein YjiS (DUF1127 family)
MLKFIKKLFKKIEKIQTRRAAYWQLQNLTDKELKDIGINRGEIRDIIESI